MRSIINLAVSAAVVLTFAVAIFAQAATDKQKIDAAASSGEYHLNRKDFQKAIDAFSEAIRLDPKNAYALARRSAAHLGLGNSSACLADINAAIGIEPNFSGHRLARANCNELAGKVFEAAADYSIAIELEPNIQNYRNLRGLMFMRMGQYGPAVEEMDKMISDQYGVFGSNYRLQRGWMKLLNNDAAGGIADLKVMAATEKLPAKFTSSKRLELRSAALFYIASVKTKTMTPAQQKAYLTDVLGRIDPKSSWALVFRYFLGEMTAEQMVAETDKTDKDYGVKTEARTYAGLLSSIRNKLAEAATHFNWVRENGNDLAFEYHIAVEQLRKKK